MFCKFTHADYGVLRQGKVTAKISRKRVLENPSEHENGSLKPDDAPVKNCAPLSVPWSSCVTRLLCAKLSVEGMVKCLSFLYSEA